jgi:hypothetical protein
MLTLAKRPHPQLGTITNTFKPISEAAYGLAMAAQVRRERNAHPTVTDDDIIDAITDNHYTTQSIAEHLEIPFDHARIMLNSMFCRDMIVKVRLKHNHLWRLK